MTLSLRPLCSSDIAERQRIGLFAEIQQMYGRDGETRPMTDQEAREWAHDDRQLWIVELDGRMIGQVTLKMIDQEHRRGQVGVGLFHPDDLGQGYGTQALGTLLASVFNDTDELAYLHRAQLRVLKINERAQASYRKLGFQVEGTERETCFLGGEWHDDLIMAVLEEDYRAFLRTEEAQKHLGNVLIRRR